MRRRASVLADSCPRSSGRLAQGQKVERRGQILAAGLISTPFRLCTQHARLEPNAVAFLVFAGCQVVCVPQ